MYIALMYFPSLEPVCCYMSNSNCCFLTCIQVSEETGKGVWYSHLFQNFTQFVVIHTVKGFSVLNEAKVDVFFFLEFPCFLYNPMNVDKFISGSCAFSKFRLYIWKFSVHVLLKPSLKILSIILLACERKAIVWTFLGFLHSSVSKESAFFGITLLWDWNKNWTFPIMWPLLSFPNLLTYWVWHFNSIIF